MRYRFGNFELDPVNGILANAGVSISLRPKVTEVLHYLVERPFEVVTKQQLLDELWPGVHVSESALPWTIMNVRRAVGQPKGANAPVETVHGWGYRWAIPVEPLVDDAVPASVSKPPQHPPFVGRQALLGLLAERLAHANMGYGSFCLLLGPAGIGKTNCMDMVARQAAAQDFAVVGTQATAEPSQPLSPWVELVSSLIDLCPEHKKLEEVLGKLSAIDEFYRTPSNHKPTEAKRCALFTSIAHALVHASKQRPILLLLDDLQWSDTETEALLSFVAPRIRRARILILTASRPSQTRESLEDPLLTAERFELQAFAPEDTTDYLVRVVGEDVSANLCQLIHEVSGGSPLLVSETLRLLILQHGRAGLQHLDRNDMPTSAPVQTLIKLQLDCLPAGGIELLQYASVLGERIDVPFLLDVANAAVVHASLVLEEASKVGILIRLNRYSYAFRHALVREAMYEGMGLVERAHIHQRVATILECRADAALQKAEIAYHHHAALPLAGYQRVYRSAIAAAQGAYQAQAFAEAATYNQWALQAMAADHNVDKAEFARTWLHCAQAQRCAGLATETTKSVERLVEIAIEIGDGKLLVQGARVLRARLAHTSALLRDPLAHKALQQALRLLPAHELALRSQARSLLSWLPPTSYVIESSKAESAHSLEEANACQDSHALAGALVARLYALSGPDDIAAQLDASQALLELTRGRHSLIAIEAYTAQQYAHLHRANISGAQQALEKMKALAKERGLAELTWHCDRHRVQHDLLQGHLNEAQLGYEQLRARSATLRMPESEFVLSQLQTHITLLTADPATQLTSALLEASLNRLGTVRLHIPFSASLGKLALAQGSLTLARQVFDEAVAHDFAAIPKSTSYLNVLCNYSLLAIGLRDKRAAHILYGLLQPYPSHNTPNMLGLYDGPVAQFLGRLAGFLGEHDSAARYFEQAAAICRRERMRSLLACTYLEHARAALNTGCSNAKALREQAVTYCEEHQFTWLAAQARTLG